MRDLTNRLSRLINPGGRSGPQQPDPLYPALVMLTGLPGCGKSTFAQRFGDFQVLNLDTFRGWCTDDTGDQRATSDAVRVQHMLLTIRLRNRVLTVVDSTNIEPDVRAGLLRHADRARMLPVAIVFDTPERQCFANNAQRTGTDRVPLAAMTRMAAQFAETTPADGPLPGFHLTRRIGPGYDRVFGTVPEGYQNAPWLR